MTHINIKLPTKDGGTLRIKRNIAHNKAFQQWKSGAGRWPGRDKVAKMHDNLGRTPPFPRYKGASRPSDFE